jgi:hypothetical protein
MESFITSGGVTLLIIAFMAVQSGVILWRRRDVRPLSATALDLAATIFPGLFIVLALHAALTGAHWMWIAGFLLASWPAHQFDLWRRGLWSRPLERRRKTGKSGVRRPA